MISSTVARSITGTRISDGCGCAESRRTPPRERGSQAMLADFASWLRSVNASTGSATTGSGSDAATTAQSAAAVSNTASPSTAATTAVATDPVTPATVTASTAPTDTAATAATANNGAPSTAPGDGVWFVNFSFYARLAGDVATVGGNQLATGLHQAVLDVSNSLLQRLTGGNPSANTGAQSENDERGAASDPASVLMKRLLERVEAALGTGRASSQSLFTQISSAARGGLDLLGDLFSSTGANNTDADSYGLGELSVPGFDLNTLGSMTELGGMSRGARPPVRNRSGQAIAMISTPVRLSTITTDNPLSMAGATGSVSTSGARTAVVSSSTPATSGTDTDNASTTTAPSTPRSTAIPPLWLQASGVRLVDASFSVQAGSAPDLGRRANGHAHHRAHEREMLQQFIDLVKEYLSKSASAPATRDDDASVDDATAAAKPGEAGVMTAAGTAPAEDAAAVPTTVALRRDPMVLTDEETAKVA